MPAALITGATAGIGRAFAEVLAEAGHDLTLVARDADRLRTVAADLTGRHSCAVTVIAADLSGRAGMAVVERHCADHPLSVLVNNAGSGMRESFVHNDRQREQESLDLLVTAPLRLTHAALPHMIERRQGSIINVGSVAAWLASGTYSAAKAWLTVFTESLATDLAGTGVHATVVAPGYTRTEFHARAGMRLGGVPGWMWLDPMTVARTGWADVQAGRVVSIPGLQYRLLATLVRTLPRPIVRSMSAARPGVQRRRAPTPVSPPPVSPPPVSPPPAPN
ncbi:MAG: SDR family NAD(P)-dependent oxidoreductase [Actinomycetales bacterium]|nr:SDR family NAD(P)-dependent oxidoreductase [Actinomycetales bacterium]